MRSTPTDRTPMSWRMRATAPVSVINTKKLTVADTIKVGVEPRALCFTPNFTRLYVACASSNTIHIINPATNTVTKVIDNPSFSNLFALTITNDGDADDNDELVYVTNLLAEYTEGSAPEPTSDLGKQGIVSVISVSGDALVDRVKLKPVKTLFQSDGRQQNADFAALSTAEQADTFAFPESIDFYSRDPAERHEPHLHVRDGSSPTGPFKFNVNVQSLVSQIRGVDDAGQTSNLNDQIKAEPATAFANGVPKHRFANHALGTRILPQFLQGTGRRFRLRLRGGRRFRSERKATSCAKRPREHQTNTHRHRARPKSRPQHLPRRGKRRAE